MAENPTDAPRERGLHQLIRFVAPGTALLPLLTLGISVLIARTLGPEGRGAYGVIVTTVAILPVFLNLGFDVAVRFWTARGETDRFALLKTASLISLGMASAAAAIAFTSWSVSRPGWIVPQELSATGALAVACLLFLVVVKSTWLNHLVGLERYGYAIWGTNLATAVQLAVLAAFAATVGLSVDVVAYTLLLQVATHIVLFLVLDGRALVRAIRAPLLPSGALREMFGYGLWQYLGSLLAQAAMRGNIYILVALGGLHETGLYTAVLGPASFLLLLGSPLGQVMAARTARRHDDASFPLRVAGALRVVFLVNLVAAAAAAVLAPSLLVWVFGERFRGGIEPFWILLPGIVGLSVVKIVIQYVAGAKQPQWNTWTSAVGAGVSLGLAYVLVPTHDATGAALATSAAYLSSAAVAVVGFLRVSGVGLARLLAFHPSDFAPLARVFGLSQRWAEGRPADPAE